MKSEKALKKLMFSIATLEELGEVLSSQNHFQDNIRMALYSVMGSLPVSKGAIFLYRRRRGKLVLEASRGLKLRSDFQIPLRPQAARTLQKLKRPIIISTPPAALSTTLKSVGPALGALQSVLLTPLTFKEELVGLISLGPKYSQEEYHPGDLDFLTVMANYVAIGIHNQELLRSLETANKALRRKITENRKLYKNLEHIYNDTVKALGTAIDAKDPYTRGHSDRVARFSVAIARRLGMSDEKVNAIRIASHLHDIGKIAIDNSILLKPSKLNDQEMTQVHRHPMVSYDILSNIKFPYPDVALITRHHHEWVNGEGYPDQIDCEGLNGGMKVIALADAFDAMTSDRPYRPALGLEKALTRLREGVFAQFDQHVARTFFQILDEEIRGLSKSPEIVSGLNQQFSPEIILNFLDRVQSELKDPVGGEADPPRV